MSGLVAATIIAGVLLIVMGVMRLGTLIRFVSHTITTGFTAGIAVTIVLFMKMVSQEAEVRGWSYYCDEDSEVTHLRELPRAVRVYEINGPMLFGMTSSTTSRSRTSRACSSSACVACHLSTPRPCMLWRICSICAASAACSW